MLPECSTFCRDDNYNVFLPVAEGFKGKARRSALGFHHFLVEDNCYILTIYEKDV